MIVNVPMPKHDWFKKLQIRDIELDPLAWGLFTSLRPVHVHTDDKNPFMATVQLYVSVNKYQSCHLNTSIMVFIDIEQDK